MMLIGHRGAKALEPENTLLSIGRAIEIGVDAVEIDVRLTKDKEIVVIHDATVDRVTNGKGPVRSYTLSEIRGLRAGKGEKIPTLDEAIDLVKGKATLIVELKEGGTEEKVVEAIERHGLHEGSYVISFWHALVKKAREIDSRTRTGVLLVGCPIDTCTARAASADAFFMKYEFVDGDFVRRAHGDGLEVHVWNIDETDLLDTYAEMGVDGIGSNDPRVLMTYFGR